MSSALVEVCGGDDTYDKEKDFGDAKAKQKRAVPKKKMLITSCDVINKAE